jgi:hypothetical protein
MKWIANGFISALIFAMLLFNTTAAIARVGVDAGSNEKFIVATHYYGLKEYSWPVNYLNAIKPSDIDTELQAIKKMGFNTIILLASWSEFEPIIGKPNNMAYRKISTIIATAKRNGLNVMIRIPYLWSLADGGNDMRERITYALLDHGNYRQALLNFLRYFQVNIIQKNSNVIAKFGSWEDYYILRDFFFSDEPVVSAYVKERFFLDTRVKSGEVARNGENYDVFNNWVDSKILEMTKVIGLYGYEIRTDADPYTKNKKLNWHSHNRFYKNESNGNLVAYWAPYFGQQNQGERINADKAVKSFAWMLDLISTETRILPFIDQLNFFDNSPGTEANAQIEVGQLSEFFEKITNTLVERTSGYALWTVRDYRHNIIFNPAFSEHLVGWKASKNVTVTDGHVKIPPGGYLTQHIPASRFLVLKSESPSLVMDMVAGKGDILIDSRSWLRVVGSGKHAKELALGNLERGLNITIKASEDSSEGLEVKWVGLLGHSQIGKVLDHSGGRGAFYDLIRGTNERAVKLASRPCSGYEQTIRLVPYSRGVFSDGWTRQSFELCDPDFKAETGFDMTYNNPSSDEKSVKISVEGIVEKTVVLEKGVGKIHVCLPPKSSSHSVSFVVSSPFIPSSQDKQSLDVRSLGVLLNGFEKCKCHYSVRKK